MANFNQIYSLYSFDLCYKCRNEDPSNLSDFEYYLVPARLIHPDDREIVSKYSGSKVLLFDNVCTEKAPKTRFDCVIMDRNEYSNSSRMTLLNISTQLVK